MTFTKNYIDDDFRLSLEKHSPKMFLEHLLQCLYSVDAAVCDRVLTNVDNVTF